MPNATDAQIAAWRRRDRQFKIDDRICAIEEALAIGETSTSIDGTTTTIDLDAMRIELASLRRQSIKSRLRRPVLSSVNLSGAMR